MTKKARCFLSALGMICPLGSNNADILHNLLSGSRAGLIQSNDYLIDRSVFVGRVVGSLPMIESQWVKHASRNNQLLLAALQKIEKSVETALLRFGPKRIAVVLGSSTSGIGESDSAQFFLKQHGKWPDHYHYQQQEMGDSARFLASYLGLDNIAYVVSTACSSSGKAFAAAQRLLRSDLCDAVLVGGVDSLCQLTVRGFASLEALSYGLCNPFSLHRDGINIGEGAALFLLTRDESEVELLGVGEASDAYHISAPDPEGVGAALAISMALKNAHVSADQIDYINLHGTATLKNDEMEATLIKKIFGLETPCSSTKGMTGHALGAAAAIEAGLCWLTLSSLNEYNKLPPHVADGTQDPALPAINLCVAHSSSKLSTTSTTIMSNSFAFGGSNVSVILGRQ